MGLAQALRYTDLIEALRLAQAPLQPQDCAAIRPGYRRRSVGLHFIDFRNTRYGIRGRSRLAPAYGSGSPSLRLEGATGAFDARHHGGVDRRTPDNTAAGGGGAAIPNGAFRNSLPTTQEKHVNPAYSAGDGGFSAPWRKRTGGRSVFP